MESFPFHVLFCLKLACLIAGFNSHKYIGWWMDRSEFNRTLEIGGGHFVRCHKVTNLHDATVDLVTSLHRTNYYRKRKGSVTINQAYLNGKCYFFKYVLCQLYSADSAHFGRLFSLDLMVLGSNLVSNEASN